MPLIEIAQDQNKAAADSDGGRQPACGRASGRRRPPTRRASRSALPQKIKDEKDLEPYERLFANTAYWKQIGEEYQNPLIVTGTVLFTPHTSAGFVQRDTEVYDGFGRRRVVPARTYMERKGFILRPKFVFIDGRTGATMYSETLPRGNALQRAAEHAGAVVVLRADGPPRARIS